MRRRSSASVVVDEEEEGWEERRKARYCAGRVSRGEVSSGGGGTASARRTRAIERSYHAFVASGEPTAADVDSVQCAKEDHRRPEEGREEVAVVKRSRRVEGGSGGERAREVSIRASQARDRVAGGVGEEPKRVVRERAEARMRGWEAALRRRWRRWRRERAGEEGARERAVVRFVVRNTICERVG